jgi:hypothetical protein
MHSLFSMLLHYAGFEVCNRSLGHRLLLLDKIVSFLLLLHNTVNLACHEFLSSQKHTFKSSFTCRALAEDAVVMSTLARIVSKAAISTLVLQGANAGGTGNSFQIATCSSAATAESYATAASTAVESIIDMMLIGCNDGYDHIPKEANGTAYAFASVRFPWKVRTPKNHRTWSLGASILWHLQAPLSRLLTSGPISFCTTTESRGCKSLS